MNLQLCSTTHHWGEIHTCVQIQFLLFSLFKFSMCDFQIIWSISFKKPRAKLLSLKNQELNSLLDLDGENNKNHNPEKVTPKFISILIYQFGSRNLEGRGWEGKFLWYKFKKFEKVELRYFKKYRMENEKGNKNWYRAFDPLLKFL